MKAQGDDTRPTLPQTLTAAATRNGLGRYLLVEPLVVGVSGGADSLALLHSLLALRGPDAAGTLHVAHLDHGLRDPDSAADARFVAQLAESWGLTCTVRRLDVGAYAKERGLSIEEAARIVRYAFLAGEAAKRGAVVAVAHNADDQVETVLMHILRGSGLSGLRGMRALTTVPDLPHDPLLASLLQGAQPERVALFRPLLGVWRRENEAYCGQVGIHPRIDPTNSDPRYTRNRVRRELLPRIERDYNRAVKDHIFKLSQLAAGEDDLLESLADQEARKLARLEPGGALCFEQGSAGAMHPALRLRAVRWAICQVAGTLDGLSHEHIEKAAGILAGESGTAVAMDLPHGVTVRRFDGIACVFKGDFKPEQSEAGEHQWPQMRPGTKHGLTPDLTLQLDDGWALLASVAEGRSSDEPGDLLALFDLDALQPLGPFAVRTRRPGDTIQPLGMEGRKRLHDLFIDAKIPRWTRDRIPLIARSHQDEEVLWVPGPGGRRSARAPVGRSTRRVLRLEFRRTGEG
jgi:tRNA(Ile)-lysidine synthase